MSADTLLDIFTPWATSFYGGLPSSTSGLGSRYDFIINGRGYMLDTAYENFSGPQSIPAIRQQADQGAHPGEGSLTREDLWSRLWTSFHHGAGQRWSDREGADGYRFRASKGVNPWTRDRLTLLKDVTQIVASATVLQAVGIDGAGYAYVNYNDNGAWKVARWDANETLNVPFSGTVPAVTLASWAGADSPQLATDGSNTYAIDNGGPNIRYSAGGGAGGSVVWSTCGSTSTCRCIGYAHGHLLVGGGGAGLSGRSLYDATVGTGGTGTLVATLSALGEAWLCFAEGHKTIYGAANSSAGQSKIYSIGYDPNSATLSAPTEAGLIPVGEQIRTIYGYLGFLFVGTNLGFRMCREAADNSLEVGPLVPVAGGVATFSALGQYVYFGWSNYDATSTGLGRIDISVFTDADLVPAYATDVMAPVGGLAVGAMTLDNGNVSVDAPRPWFAVTGTGGGIYVEHATDFVASGTLDTGIVGYGITQPKDALYVDVQHLALVGSVAVSMAVDEGTFAAVDVSAVPGSTGYEMTIGHRLATRDELRLILTAATATTGPTVTSLELLVYPAVARGDTWLVPLDIASELVGNDGASLNYNLWDEYAYFKQLAAGRTPSSIQFGTLVATMSVDDYAMPVLMKEGHTLAQWKGTILLKLKNLERSTLL